MEVELSRPLAVAFAAASLAAAIAAAPVFAASNAEMNAPPKPWADTGAKPFVQLDAQKHPTMIGLTIPSALFGALPKARSEAVYPLPGAGLVQTANLQWHPVGHEPEHVYDMPHFDVHFYTITEAVRGGIVPGAAAGKIRPTKAMMPPKSILAPDYVPGMGMHVISAMQPEFNKGKFTISPIIGYWNGQVAFFEVMFSKKWIDQKTDTAGAFLQPTKVTQHGWYPTKYSVKYDAAKDDYTVALTDFTKR
jgi:hypothetical protein